MSENDNSKLITGIHHITAISGFAQQNIDFYSGILGLRLVKRTVNFDYPEVYHFYFGNETGDPGTIMTTFPYGADMPAGRHGKGMVNTTAFSVPYSAIDYWQKRLKHFNLLHKHPQERFGGREVVIYLEDPDGMGIELIFNENDSRPPISTGAVPPEHSIRGFHHAELWLESYERTAGVLTEGLNHYLIKEGAGRQRYGVKDEPGHFVDLVTATDGLRGLEGSGMVHHIAFSTPNLTTLNEIGEKIKEIGLRPTDVRDRHYFKSKYFREPGGILFEIATTDPGFTVDEPLDELGHSLMLPPQFEADREALNDTLPHFEYNPSKFSI